MTYLKLDCAEWMSFEEKILNKALYLFVSTFKIHIQNQKQQYILFYIQKNEEFQRLSYYVQQSMKKDPKFPFYVCSKILKLIINAFVHFPFLTKSFSIFSPKSYFFFNEMMGFLTPIIKQNINQNKEVTACFDILSSSILFAAGEIKKSLGFMKMGVDELEKIFGVQGEVLSIVNEDDEEYMRKFLNFENEYTSKEKLSKLIILQTIIKREEHNTKLDKKAVVFSTLCKDKSVKEMLDRAMKYDQKNYLGQILLAHHYGDNYDMEEAEKNYKKSLNMLPKKCLLLPKIYYFLAIRRYTFIAEGKVKEEEIKKYEVKMEEYLKEGKKRDELMEKVFEKGLGKSLGLNKLSSTLGSYVDALITKYFHKDLKKKV